MTTCFEHGTCLHPHLCHSCPNGILIVISPGSALRLSVFRFSITPGQTIVFLFLLSFLRLFVGHCSEKWTLCLLQLEISICSSPSWLDLDRCGHPCTFSQSLTDFDKASLLDQLQRIPFEAAGLGVVQFRLVNAIVFDQKRRFCLLFLPGFPLLFLWFFL